MTPVVRRHALTGAGTLFRKEVLRFWKVSFQTVAAPVLTSILYLLVFGHVLEDRVQVYPGVAYTSFLIPGLVMMSVLQNSFANTSTTTSNQSYLFFNGRDHIHSLSKGMLAQSLGLRKYSVKFASGVPGFE